ncbi:MAG: hypothetical protein ACR2MN_18070 [Acidimicrobiales bacterium]
MCVLCGAPVVRRHWTDRRDDGDAGDGALPDQDGDGRRRREHLRRIAVLRAVLHRYGLGVTDFAGRGFVVTNGKGAGAIVRDLGELWPVADRLAQQKVDPLDPTLLEAL